MKKLYQKSELYFSLVWIGLYVVVMNIALQFCGGFDSLAEKTVPQMLVPVVCVMVLAAASCAADFLKNTVFAPSGAMRSSSCILFR